MPSREEFWKKRRARERKNQKGPKEATGDSRRCWVRDMQPLCPAPLTVTTILGSGSAVETLKLWIHGSQTRLHFRVTLKGHLLNVPQSRPHPRRMTSHRWGGRLRPGSWGRSPDDSTAAGLGASA